MTFPQRGIPTPSAMTKALSLEDWGPCEAHPSPSVLNQWPISAAPHVTVAFGVRLVLPEVHDD